MARSRPPEASGLPCHQCCSPAPIDTVAKIENWTVSKISRKLMRVIELRLQMIALGGSTPGEMLLMVTEKIDAMEQAKAIMISGGDPSLVVNHYRKILEGNVFRLSNAQ